MKLFKAITCSILSLICLACAEKEEPKTKEAVQAKPAADVETVVISTSEGDITLELYADKAPITVKNFLSYVDKEFYDGTVFHRIIPSFMIQGGGFALEGDSLKKKPTEAPIKNEASNGLQNEVGTIAMARTQVFDSATSQFFINVNKNAFLDSKYCVFGKVTAGLDVAKKIVAKPRGTGLLDGRPAGDVPKTPIVIKSIRRAK